MYWHKWSGKWEICHYHTISVSQSASVGPEAIDIQRWIRSNIHLNQYSYLFLNFTGCVFSLQFVCIFVFVAVTQLALSASCLFFSATLLVFFSFLVVMFRLHSINHTGSFQSFQAEFHFFSCSLDWCFWQKKSGSKNVSIIPQLTAQSRYVDVAESRL